MHIPHHHPWPISSYSFFWAYSSSSMSHQQLPIFQCIFLIIIHSPSIATHFSRQVETWVPRHVCIGTTRGPMCYTFIHNLHEDPSSWTDEKADHTLATECYDALQRKETRTCFNGEPELAATVLAFSHMPACMYMLAACRGHKFHQSRASSEVKREAINNNNKNKH